jgi:HPt (histidine-containing phosphotransfer) domain-containing protein
MDEYFDFSTALSRLMGNKKLYAKMLGMLINSKEFDAFEQAVSEGDLKKASEHAHTIKGMTGNLAVTKLYEISAKLNQEMNNGVKNDALIENFRIEIGKSLDLAKIVQETFSK